MRVQDLRMGQSYGTPGFAKADRGSVRYRVDYYYVCSLVGIRYPVYSAKVVIKGP